MSGAFPLRGLSLGLAALAAPSLAWAELASPDRNAVATVRIAPPASIRKLQNLNFASLSVTGAGTAIIDPNTDAMTTTGGVVHATGLAYAALFQGIAPTKALVIIRIPRGPITLTRVDGTETMTVSGWTLSGNERRTVAEREAFDFKVGGTLNVNAGQVEGLYVGTFAVEIQYP